MGNLVVRATASQAVPPLNDPNFVAGNFCKGILAIQASGTGTGPWGGTFNVAYVSPAGVMGTILSYTITDASPLAEDAKPSGGSSYAAWWTNVTGSPVLTGTVDG